jgi:hypothetical protein
MRDRNAKTYLHDSCHNSAQQRTVLIVEEQAQKTDCAVQLNCGKRLSDTSGLRGQRMASCAPPGDIKALCYAKRLVENVVVLCTNLRLDVGREHPAHPAGTKQGEVRAPPLREGNLFRIAFTGKYDPYSSGFCRQLCVSSASYVGDCTQNMF